MVEINSQRYDTLKEIMHTSIMTTKDMIEKQKEERDRRVGSGDLKSAGLFDAGVLKLQGMLDAYEFCQASMMKVERGDFG